MITNQNECELALQELTVVDPSVGWTGEDLTDIPGGCSYRPDASQCGDDDQICRSYMTTPDVGHFVNTSTVGNGRADLRPVCKISKAASQNHCFTVKQNEFLV